MTPQEEWLPIPGYVGHYEVSNLGRVKSWRPWPGRGDTPRIVSPAVAKKGHLNVCLHLNGVRKTKQVHALVLLAFVGPYPPGLQIRHLNGDPTDNRLVNLVYGTSSENRRDSILHGTSRNQNTGKQLCNHGHPLSGSNLYVASNGTRACKTCRAEANRRWRRAAAG